MWTCKLLKANGRAALQGRYWRCLGIGLIAAVLGGSKLLLALFTLHTQITGWLDSVTRPMVWAGNNPQSELDQGLSLIQQLGLWPILVAIGLGLVLAVLVYAAFVSGPALVGYCRYMMENRQGSSRVGTLFSAFRVPYGNVVRVQFLVGMLVLAGCILFVVPGIFLHYRYRMVPYLLAENPYLPAGRAMQLSRRMMHGEKWHAFLLDLSFLGWYLLCVLTLGFGLVFLEPYRMVTNAELYALLRSKAFAYGYTGESELGGFMRYSEDPVESDIQ